MADAFTKVFIHCVFAVKNRQALISMEWDTHLYKYITGIIQSRGHKMLAINGMPDHVHMLIGMKPHEALSDLIRETKKSSTLWVKTQGLTSSPFHWQSGYGAFSYAESELATVGRYIDNQKVHHMKGENSFKEEFHQLLKRHQMEVGRKETFEFFD